MLIQSRSRPAVYPAPASATLTPDDCIRLTRNRFGHNLVTLRPPGRAPTTGTTEIILSEGEPLSQGALAAAVTALRHNWTTTITCCGLQHAVEVYTDVLEVQDGRLSASELPVGAAQ